MNRQQLKDEIIFRLTGGVLDCELDDKALDLLINISMREIQRYICTTKLITVPFSRCIDVSKYKVNSIARVYRSIGLVSTDGGESSNELVQDPLYATQWQLLSTTGANANYTDFAYNFASWNTLLQIKNTVSTDMAFRYDQTNEHLYINVSAGVPERVTIEYIPRYDDVSEIKSDFWIDNLTKLCVAQAKVTLGRIRTRYTVSSSLYTQDGDRILEEGNSELTALREAMIAATQLVYPID